MAEGGAMKISFFHFVVYWLFSLMEKHAIIFVPFCEPFFLKVREVNYLGLGLCGLACEENSLFFVNLSCIQVVTLFF